jgi:hypothetical protein
MHCPTTSWNRSPLVLRLAYRLRHPDIRTQQRTIKSDRICCEFDAEAGKKAIRAPVRHRGTWGARPKSRSTKCARPAFMASWSIARTTAARTQ